MPEKGCYLCLPDAPVEGLEDPCDECEADWMEYVRVFYECPSCPEDRNEPGQCGCGRTLVKTTYKVKPGKWEKTASSPSDVYNREDGS